SVALGSGAASAAVVDLSAGDLVNVVGGPGSASTAPWAPSNLYLSNISYSVNGNSKTTKAGMFDLLVEHVGEGDWQRLLAFCLEPDKNFAYNNPFLVVDNISNDLRKMWGTYFADVDTQLEAAAFQIAIWELVVDAGGGYDLTSGNFVLGSGQNALETKANEYLSGWDAWAALLRLQDLGKNAQGGKQDLLVEVPVPGTLALLGIGLAALGAVRRKKVDA
ncbi:MAG: PEP-CTERM sorting domain-containing protein, partial [Gammaproteobacteria bacterium]